MTLKVNFKELNDLIKKLGAAPSSINLNNHNLTPAQMGDLKSSKGLEYKIDDIEGDENGLMYIAGDPVVVFIQDSYSSADDLRNNPKGKGVTRFHIAYDCETIQQKVRENRYNSRYHFTKSTRGEFDMYGIKGKSFFNKVRQVFGGGKVKVEKAKIGICQNCLKSIDYKDYYKCDVPKEIIKWREEFLIQDFFDNFSQRITERPRYSDQTLRAPIYTAEYRRLAKQKKIRLGYKCEGCGVDLSNSPDRTKLLHCDHENGDITDNRPRNLRILCISCHRKHGYNPLVGSQQDYLKCEEYRKQQGKL